jgi:molybdenum cofactor biosynthesis protein B
MGLEEHRRESEKIPGARCAILTISDSRTKETDDSGRTARELLEGAGHSIALYKILPNDPAAIAETLRELLRSSVDVVLTIGGTGISRRDGTIDAVAPMIARPLPGFGELFRHYSLPDIGTAAILSRAQMGVTAEGRILVCIPGSISAVRLALERILLKELMHLVWELRK